MLRTDARSPSIRRISPRDRASRRRTVPSMPEAIADATEAIFLNPDNSAAYAIRADCRMAIGDADGATHDAQELFRIDPT